MVGLRLTDARLNAVLVGGDPSKSLIGKGNGWFGFGGGEGALPEQAWG